MSTQTGSTTLRKVGTDANDTNLILIRQADRVASSLRLVCLFLSAFSLISLTFTALSLLVNKTHASDWGLGFIDMGVAVAGLAAGLLGLWLVSSIENVTPENAKIFWMATAGYGVLFTLYTIFMSVAKFTSISTYMQKRYHLSPISSMTSVSLFVVVVAYVLSYFSLKAYIFLTLIQEIKNVDPRTRFAASLGKILGR